jgi:hypothetical protein
VESNEIGTTTKAKAYEGKNKEQNLDTGDLLIESRLLVGQLPDIRDPEASRQND